LISGRKDRERGFLVADKMQISKRSMPACSLSVFRGPCSMSYIGSLRILVAGLLCQLHDLLALWYPLKIRLSLLDSPLALSRLLINRIVKSIRVLEKALVAREAPINAVVSIVTRIVGRGKIKWLILRLRGCSDSVGFRLIAQRLLHPKVPVRV